MPLWLVQVLSGAAAGLVAGASLGLSMALAQWAPGEGKEETGEETRREAISMATFGALVMGIGGALASLFLKQTGVNLSLICVLAVLIILVFSWFDHQARKRVANQVRGSSSS